MLLYFSVKVNAFLKNISEFDNYLLITIVICGNIFPQGLLERRWNMGIEYIKQIKKERGLTNEELSKLSGVPIGTLNKILSGHTPDPQFETVKSICRALGISLSALDDYEQMEVHTIAAHHDGEDWTEAELAEIEEFKKYVKSKRK